MLFSNSKQHMIAMGSDQHFCLRWNNFHSNIATSFEHLRDHEDFVDVTLACEGRSLKAHKVVLSACSPYFRNLLKVIKMYIKAGRCMIWENMILKLYCLNQSFFGKNIFHIFAYVSLTEVSIEMEVLISLKISILLFLWKFFFPAKSMPASHNYIKRCGICGHVSTSQLCLSRRGVCISGQTHHLLTHSWNASHKGTDGTKSAAISHSNTSAAKRSGEFHSFVFYFLLYYAVKYLVKVKLDMYILVLFLIQNTKLQLPTFPKVLNVSLMSTSRLNEDSPG